MPDAIKAKTGADDLTYRALPIRRTNGGPSSLDEAGRSVEVIVATENPVKVYDFERFEVINEVLLIAGGELPGSRQVPLLDSHNRGNSSSVIGSIRGLTPNADMITGDAVFSEADEARGPWQKVREGHLTDFSAGYQVTDAEWIPEGESQRINGKVYQGPLKIAKKWTLKEVSVVPIGADEMATARASQRSDNLNSNTEGKIMPEKTEIFSKEEVIAAERERMAEISAMCHRFDAPRDILTQLIDRGDSVADAKIVISEIIMRRELAKEMPGHMPPGGMSGAYVTVDQSDKREAAAVDGLCLRAGTVLKEPAPGANEYRVLSLPAIAKDCLEASGTNTRGMSKDRIVREALSQRAGTVGDFTSVLSNTANKILKSAYEQAPSTWRQWCNILPGKDFKQISVNALSGAPSLDEVPEHGEYLYGVFSDSSEVVSLATYGKLFAITRQAIISDDLGAFTRVPASFGQSAARKINSMAYAVLTANSAMSDGIALFHASHSNYVASGAGAAPSIATLGAARLAMRTQTGLASETLNIAPRFLIVPAAIETVGDQLLNSTGDLSDNKSSGVLNPMYRRMDLVVESLLDADSAVHWYVAADPAKAETVGMFFLDGKETPYITSRDGWTVDGTEFKCRIDVAAKSLDHRSLYMNYGS